MVIFLDFFSRKIFCKDSFAMSIMILFDVKMCVYSYDN